MKELPSIGSKVIYKSRVNGRMLTGTVIKYYQTYWYDEENERSTNIVNPESEWKIEVKPDKLPSWWPYPNYDTFCPGVETLKSL